MLHPPNSKQPRERKVLIATVLLLLAGAVALVPARLNGISDPPRRYERPAKLEWGLYQILWSNRYAAMLERELAAFASKPDYVMFYRDLGRPFPRKPIEGIAGLGAATVVSLELWSWGGQREASFLSAINRGKLDGSFREWASQAKAYGQRVLLRFGFEFNGDWFSWSGDPEAYVAAWRRAHDIFAAVGAKNVEWVWAPNVVSCPDTPKNDMHAYYPGDDYVDWVGVDGYNFGDHHDQWHKWQSFQEVFEGVLDGFERRYPDKPVFIAEFGCAPGEAEARQAWIRQAYHFLKRRKQVRACLWFNYNKRSEGEPNWRIDATPGAQQAFNETFARP